MHLMTVLCAIVNTTCSTAVIYSGVYASYDSAVCYCSYNMQYHSTRQLGVCVLWLCCVLLYSSYESAVCYCSNNMQYSSTRQWGCMHLMTVLCAIIHTTFFQPQYWTAGCMHLMTVLCAIVHTTCSTTVLDSEVYGSYDCAVCYWSYNM